MRIISLLKQDLHFQFRSGIHPLYLVVSVMYIIILKLIPETWIDNFFPAMILSDPAIMGFLFVGAQLFFERDQGIFPLLSASPVMAGEYLWSKIITLTLTAVGSTCLIAAIVLGFKVNYLLLVTGTGLTAALITLIGTGISLKFRNVSSFMIFSGLIDIPVILPLISTFGFWDSYILFLIPTRGTLVYLEAAMGIPQKPGFWIAGTASLLLWMVPAGILAMRRVQREFTLLPGGQNE